MKATADLLRSKPPVWDEKGGSIDHYYWYYATYALFQYTVATTGRNGRRSWRPQWSRTSTAMASKKNLLGSWDPIGAWGEDGGRVYSTAILTLTLEAYYRYSRLVR